MQMTIKKRGIEKIADKYGICILLIHHLRKQTASDPFDQISGSTGLMGVADTSWVMQRKRMSQTADILLTGRDMDDRTLHLREENCIWTLEDEETAEERDQGCAGLLVESSGVHRKCGKLAGNGLRVACSGRYRKCQTEPVHLQHGEVFR